MKGNQQMQPDIFAQARMGGIHLFGAGGFARDLARVLPQHGITVRGFLTSGKPAQTELLGLPVRQISAENLLEAPVWMGAFNHMPHSDYADIWETLKKTQPATQVVWPQTFYGSLKSSLGFRFWLHAPEAYAAEEPAIAHARQLLADEASRKIYDAVLKFRTDATFYSCPPPVQNEMQYLPNWLLHHLQTHGVSALRLVDGGAYHGETLEALSQCLPVEKAWTFEPDVQSYAYMVNMLRAWPNSLVHLPAGLANTTGFAAFSPGQGEASRFGEGGTHHVPVVALDECLHQADINFIKLDLEGHEMAALAGMRQTLLTYRPTLAIAVYHCWDDLWRIPTWLNALNLGYQFRLGVHGNNTFDVVLYATQENQHP